MRHLITRCDEAEAFPTGLRAAVLEIVALASKGEQHPPRYVFNVILDGEVLRIPCRLYYDPALLRRTLSVTDGTHQLIVACLGTRHHDGYLRQECLKVLLASDASWLTPFILQLAGEYVVEIVDDVAKSIAQRDASVIAKFARENPAYMATLERRVTSYWSCYHRQAYPERSDYPGAIVVAKIKAMCPPLNPSRC